jgi:hypothetical protein
MRYKVNNITNNEVKEWCLKLITWRSLTKARKNLILTSNILFAIPPDCLSLSRHKNYNTYHPRFFFMEKIKCPHCGASYYPDSPSCPKCGQKLTSSLFGARTQKKPAPSIPQSTLKDFSSANQNSGGSSSPPLPSADNLFSGTKTPSVVQPPSPPPLQRQISPHSFSLVILLCIFVGAFGIHRFVVGKKGSALVLLLITCTAVGSVVSLVWVILDLVSLATGKFTDAEGRVVKN